MHSSCTIQVIASLCPALGSASRCSSNLHTHSTIQSVSLPSVSAPGSHKHVFIVFYIVYLVLSYYLLYLSSGLSTDVFHIKMNTHSQQTSNNEAVMWPNGWSTQRVRASTSTHVDTVYAGIHPPKPIMHIPPISAKFLIFMHI